MKQSIAQYTKWQRFHLLWVTITFLFAGCSDSNEKIMISVSPESFLLEMVGGEISMTAQLSGELKVSSPTWVESKEIQTSADGQVHTFLVKTNLTGKDRTGNITFTDGTSQAVATITQKGGEVYTPSEDLEGVEVATKYVKPIGGKASEEKKSAPFSRAWDGDKSKDPYMTDYSDTQPANFPVKLDLYFDESLDFVDQIIYYPPNSGDGAFGKTRILVSKDEKATDDSQFEEVAYVDLGMKNGVVQRISIPREVKEVKTVRLSVEEGRGNELVAIEIEVYTKNLTAFDPTTLFTDGSCSELKAGVGENEIDAYPYAFFKNIASHLLKGIYPCEFRIGEYKAWQHPYVQSKENKTTTYSLLDNPTGISVKTGETLVVMVGDTHGEEVSLRIVDWDGEEAAKDGFGTYTSHFLSSGLNRIENCQRGLAYVMYHTDHFQTAQPIKVHIASGTINGYYDSSKHQPTLWKELLEAATNKHFDVIGKYAHLVFPVSNLQTIKNGQTWLDFFDSMVYEESKFMGLEKYDRMFNNRMLFNVMYNDSYMYSSSYHTGYSKGTIEGLCDLEGLKKSCWGPAHEVGHSNQTRPGLKWHGLTEVTNNIMSMYIERIATSAGSRLLNKKNYPKAMTDAFANKVPYIKLTRTGSSGEVPFNLVVPFWQLQLYMGYVLGKDDFYKDLYEAVRKDENDKDSKTKSGEIQLDFVYKCCLVSGLDLSDFFTKWGFFRPMDKFVIDDYGEATYEVKQEYIDRIKADIAALSLPKPQHKFEYITELSENVYKEGGKVQRGTATRSGETFTMNAWKNVVAFEVRNSVGKLLYVSPEPSFTMNAVPDRVTVKAIDVYGNGTPVLF